MVFCLQSLQSFASLCIWQKFKHMDIIFQTSTLELLSYKVDFCPNSLIELDKIIDLTLKTYSDDPVVEKMYSNSYLKGYSSKNFICTKIKSIWGFFSLINQSQETIF